MYKTDRLHNWTPLTMSDQRTIVLNDLVPGHKYQIRITAFNEAGSTEAEYHFMTPIASLQSNFVSRKIFPSVKLIISFFLSFFFANCLSVSSVGYFSQTIKQSYLWAHLVPLPLFHSMPMF